MENQNARIISGVSRPQQIVDVEVKVDETVVKKAAKVATTVLMQKFGNALSVTRDDINEFHEVALNAVIAKSIDPEANIGRVMVPAYFSFLIKGVEDKIGRTIISPVLSTKPALDQTKVRGVELELRALGVTMVRVHQPNTLESRTLHFDRETIDGVECIVGPEGNVDVDDLVRRGFLAMDEANRAVLRGIAGDLACSYGELDVLLEETVASSVRVSLS